MTDERHTSTYAKAEEAIRQDERSRSSPESTTLADELDRMLRAYLHAGYKGNERIVAEVALRNALWDNKAGIVAYLRRDGVAQRQQQPIAWILKYRTKHTPESVSAYLDEKDAERAASNVRMYAHASDVVVIPAYADTSTDRQMNEGGK